MDDNRVSMLERLASAMVSGRLQLKEDGATDLDYIIALGMAVQNIGSPASSLLRLYLVATPDAYRGALSSAVMLARKLNVKRGWNLHHKDITRIAGTALKYHINPVCPECLGRKFQLMPNTPVLSTRVCKRCHGSGLRPLPIKNSHHIAGVLYAIESIKSVTESEIRKRLGRGNTARSDDCTLSPAGLRYPGRGDSCEVGGEGLLENDRQGTTAKYGMADCGESAVGRSDPVL